VYVVNLLYAIILSVTIYLVLFVDKYFKLPLFSHWSIKFITDNKRWGNNKRL